jgi:hypothetical protein
MLISLKHPQLTIPQIYSAFHQSKPTFRQARDRLVTQVVETQIDDDSSSR